MSHGAQVKLFHDCNLQLDSDVPPTWSNWNAWSECSVTCGSGSLERSRYCSVQGACAGDAYERAYCEEQRCRKYAFPQVVLITQSAL